MIDLSKPKRSKRSLATEIRANAANYLMLLPFAVLFLFFTVLPILSSVVLSFTDFDMVQMPDFNGFSNYLRLLLNDEEFMICVKNTLIFAFATGPISYIACFVFAWLINELSPSLRTVMTTVFYAPSISGTLYAIFTWIFSGDMNGMVNSFLLRYGFINEPIQWLTDAKYVLTVVIIVQIWISLGSGFLAFIAGLQGIDSQIYEAGAIDGIKNRGQELIYLTLPSMGPQLFFAAVMQIGASFSVSTIIVQLAGFPTTDYAADTIVTYIMDHASNRFEMGYASAAAVVLFVMMVVTNAIVRKIINRIAPS